MSSIPTEANGELQRANTAALYAATMSRHLQVTHVLTCCLSQRRQFGNCHPHSVRLKNDRVAAAPRQAVRLSFESLRPVILHPRCSSPPGQRAPMRPLATTCLVISRGHHYSHDWDVSRNDYTEMRPVVAFLLGGPVGIHRHRFVRSGFCRSRANTLLHDISSRFHAPSDAVAPAMRADYDGKGAQGVPQQGHSATWCYKF